MDFLCECSSDRDRREALEKLPPDLPSSYIRILERANKASTATQSLVSRTIQWIMHSKRALATEELLQALSINSGDTDFDPGAMPTVDDILHWCSSLVRLNTPSNRFELAHFTVKEFLTAIDTLITPQFAQYNLNIQHADIMIAQTCMICLNWKTFENLPVPITTEEFLLEERNIAKEYPFYIYASDYWDSHVGQHMDEAPLVNLVRSLFDLGICNRFRCWALFRFRRHILETCEEHNEDNDFYPSTISKLSPLHMGACVALPEICKWLIAEGANIEDDVGFGTALWFANLGPATLERDYENVISLLTDGTIVPTSARISVVHLLLQAGSDPNRKREFAFDRSLVGLAAQAESYNEPACIPLLLNAGASISDEDIEDVLSLYRSWYRDHELDFCLEGMETGGTARLLMDATSTSMATSRPQRQEMLYELAVLFLRHDVESAGTKSVLDFDFEGRASDNLFQEVVKYFTDAIEGKYENDDELKEPRARRFVSCIQNTAPDNESFTNIIWDKLRICFKFANMTVMECLVDKVLELSLVDEEGNTPLHIALDMFSEHENVDVIRLLIDQGIDIATSNNQQEIALHLAAEYDDIDLMKLIWAHSEPAALEIQTAGGMTPLKIAIKSKNETTVKFLIQKHAQHHMSPIKSTLHFAITHESADILELLLKQSLDIEDVDDEGLTPLLQASYVEGSLPAFSLLLDWGASCSSQDRNGNGAIHILSQTSDEISHEKLRVLLGHECNLEDRNSEGLTALIMACRANNLIAVKLLLESGAKPCSASPPHNITALHWSAYLGCSELTDLLLKYGGGGIEARTEDGSTPLLIAAQQNQWSIVHQLIGAGANPKAQTRVQNSVLHFAALAGSAETVWLLLDTCPSLDIQQKSENGGTAIMLTGWSANRETFQLLLERGAQVNGTCSVGTMAHFAVAAHEDNIRQALLQYSIDWNSKAILDPPTGQITGAFPIHVAAAKGWNNAIRFLLQNRLTNVDARTDQGHTPLALAINNGLIGTVKILLGAGANPNIAMKSTGKSLLQSAAELGFYEIVQALLEFGSDPIIPEYHGIINQESSWRSRFPHIANLIDNKVQQNASMRNRGHEHCGSERPEMSTLAPLENSPLATAIAIGNTGSHSSYNKLPFRPLFPHQLGYKSAATQTEDNPPLSDAQSSSNGSCNFAHSAQPLNSSLNSPPFESPPEANPRRKRQRT